MRRLFLGLFAMLIVCTAVVGVFADDDDPTKTKLESPKEAWAALNAEIAALPRGEMRAARLKRAADYLDAFDIDGEKPAGEDWLYLGLFQVAADRAHAAYTCFHAAMTQAELDAADNARAGRSIAALLANATHCQELEGKACVADALELVDTWLSEDRVEDTVSMCAAAHMSLGGFFARAHETDRMIAHYTAAANLRPSNAYGAGRSISRALMSSTHAMADYPKQLDVVKGIQAELLPLAQAALDGARTAQAGVEADAAASDREKQMAQRRVRSAERGVTSLGKMAVPFEMLGKPAPAWTVEHAFGDVKTLEELGGQVVLVDFWATWCHWCIRSFPAVRDLLNACGDQGFAVIGVTATSSAVFESRYELDDDLQDKQPEGERSKPAARLARGTAAPDPVKGVLAPAAYRAAETKAIQAFIKNHEMTWPVVMIEKEEPGEKFALTGWPHAVVLDRQGRVRYFKVGALLRDRPEQVAQFRAVLDSLLAEGAPESD